MGTAVPSDGSDFPRERDDESPGPPPGPAPGVFETQHDTSTRPPERAETRRPVRPGVPWTAERISLARPEPTDTTPPPSPDRPGTSGRPERISSASPEQGDARRPTPLPDSPQEPERPERTSPPDSPVRPTMDRLRADDIFVWPPAATVKGLAPDQALRAVDSLVAQYKLTKSRAEFLQGGRAPVAAALGTLRALRLAADAALAALADVSAPEVPAEDFTDLLYTAGHQIHTWFKDNRTSWITPDPPDPPAGPARHLVRIVWAASLRPIVVGDTLERELRTLRADLEALIESDDESVQVEAARSLLAERAKRHRVEKAFATTVLVIGLLQGPQTFAEATRETIDLYQRLQSIVVHQGAGSVADLGGDVKPLVDAREDPPRGRW